MLKVSYSELKLFRTCRLAYHYQYVRGITKKTESDALVMGRAFHEWAAKWYGLHPSERAERRAHELARETSRDDRVMAMATAFVDYLGPDEHLYPVETEVYFEFPLHNKVILEGYVDGVVTRPNGLVILEHKTGNPNEEYLALIDEQTVLYAHALSQIRGIPVERVIYNTVTKPTDRRYGFSSTAARFEVERDERDGILALTEARETAEEILKLYKDGYRYRTRGTHCVWCEYNLLCMTELAGGDIEGVITMSYKDRGVRGEKVEAVDPA